MLEVTLAVLWSSSVWWEWTLLSLHHHVVLFVPLNQCIQVTVKFIFRWTHSFLPQISLHSFTLFTLEARLVFTKTASFKCFASAILLLELSEELLLLTLALALSRCLKPFRRFF